MLNIIAAIGKNRELGKENKLVFRIKEDMEFFKKMTLGQTVIMGRKTLESIGHPLPGRINVVISRHNLSETDENGNVLNGIITEQDPEALFRRLNEKENFFVIGGASIYKQALPYADNLYLTEIDETTDADCYFPQFDKSKYSKEVLQKGDNFEIVKYRRLK